MRFLYSLRDWLPIVVAVPLVSLVAPAAIAQRVLEGLPPPPALPPADQYSAPTNVTVPGMAPAPATAPASQSPRPPARREQGRSNQRPSSQRALVVYGDSPLLLSQVQQIVPTAAIQEFRGQRLIYVGTFNNDVELRNQVVALRSQGIQPEVLQLRPNEVVQASVPIQPPIPGTDDLLPVTPVPREVVFGQQPSFDSAAVTTPTNFSQPDNRAYFIVVPGDRTELNAIGNQIIRLGQGFAIAQLVEERDDRRGAHVRVGPFTSRSAAERWNRYLRDFGMNARVYYRR